MDIKMETPTDEEIAKRVSDRLRVRLEQERQHFGGQKATERISRFLPLVRELTSIPEDQMLLAFLLDKYAWRK